jgi:glycosyltransferase involved in cell wall biosynthesis
VVTDWAADAEVVGPGGVLVPPLIDRYGEPVRYHSRYGMDWAVPDARGFHEPVIDLLRKPARRRELGRAGRRHVQQSFNWDEAAVSFLELLTEALTEPVAA